jgi:large subunit ribosomal protein L6
MHNTNNYPLRQPKQLNVGFSVKEKALVVERNKQRFYYPLSTQKFLYSSKDRKIWLTASRKRSKAFLNLSKILLAQIFLGILLSYRRKLKIVGLGYQATVEKEQNKNVLVLKLGYSHLIRLPIPQNIQILCPKPRILLVKGINLQQVHNYAYFVRQCRVPLAYKEKGIYFIDEPLKLKQGKKT